MMGASRRARNARLKGGRYTGRIAFPLAFCGQNDIFSGSSHYSTINGKESGGSTLRLRRSSDAQIPLLKNWGGLDEKVCARSGIFSMCAVRAFRAGSTGHSV